MTNYTKADYERDIKILADAPEGATHVDSSNYYLRCKSDKNESTWQWYVFNFEWDSVDSQQIGDWCNVRSLDDIRNLVAMYEREQQSVNISNAWQRL